MTSKLALKLYIWTSKLQSGSRLTVESLSDRSSSTRALRGLACYFCFYSERIINFSLVFLLRAVTQLLQQGLQQEGSQTVGAVC